MEKKLKGLIFGDDIRTPTGVGIMLNSLVMHTYNKIEWIQAGGGLKHPEPNTVTSIEGKCKIYAIPTGYGNQNQIRELISIENPDFIFMMTDPRYFINHFRLENEIRQNIPIIYYNIWDNYPIPLYNTPFYQSCDGLACINYQTYKMVKEILKDAYPNTIVSHIPHGVDINIFKPMDIKTKDVRRVFKKVLSLDDFNRAKLKNDFHAVLDRTNFIWVGKNQRRKRPLDILYSYLKLCSMNDEFMKSTSLIMHTHKIHEAGTDLVASFYQFLEMFGLDFFDVNLYFTENSQLTREELNLLYNVGDIFINSSDAEGFGLPMVEAVASGLGVIHTVTGGLQDQVPLREMYDEDEDYQSLNLRYQQHRSNIWHEGEWHISVFPSSSSLIGGVPTPYIFEDTISVDVWQHVIYKAYTKKDELKLNARTKGREYLKNNNMTISNMSENLYIHIKEVVRNFKPQPRIGKLII